MGTSRGAALDQAAPESGSAQGRPEDEAARRQRLETSLEQGLEGTFPASDPVSVVQPAP
jgi:hypothetical protein